MNTVAAIIVASLFHALGKPRTGKFEKFERFGRKSFLPSGKDTIKLLIIIFHMILNAFEIKVVGSFQMLLNDFQSC